eukprot:gene10020-11043_t
MASYDDIVLKIKEDPAAAEFKVAIFSAALLSYRKSSCVLPFPPSFVNEDGTKCIEKLSHSFSRLPSLEEFCSSAGGKLSKDIITLMGWIVMEKAFQITTCKDNPFEKLQMKTGKASFPLQPDKIFEVQYLDSPSSEKFKNFKLTYDVKYGYHGSRLDNFHSILHHGLQVHMTKNALYGEGVYLSEDLSVTMPYTISGEIWKHSRLAEKLSCVAVCEIIDHPLVKCKVEEKSSTRARAKDSMAGDVPEKYFVVTNSELVRLKYVLMFADKKVCKRKRQPFILFRYPVAGILILYVIFLLLMGLFRSNSFRLLYKRYWANWLFSTD